MNLLLDRKWKKENYTIGNLYIDNKFFANTLEDTDRGLNSSMLLKEICNIKIPHNTAIPTGIYKVLMNTISPKYSKNEWYIRNCNHARMPRLYDVKGYEGVLIHPGNTAKDTDGCILVGKNSIKGMVTNSKDYFLILYKLLFNAYKKGEDISITIQ